MVKKFNISKPEKYTSNGAEKTYWANVGTMTEFSKEDGSVSRVIEIPAIGLKAQVFAIESKETQPTANSTESVPEVKYEEGEVNPEDIPF